MAGRFLLIEFDDEATANRLREQIDVATRKGRGYRVIGLFSRPGPKFCRCGSWVSTRGNQATTKRGRKFGWFVCTECKRPAPVMSHLVNLLKPSEIIDPPMHQTLNGTSELGFYFYGISAPELGSKAFKE